MQNVVGVLRQRLEATLKVHRIEQRQFLPLRLEDAWSYFATPKHLEEMTPPDLNFEILSQTPATVHNGLMIAYRIRAIAGLPMNWLTEIKYVEARTRFVDEQRSGPFAFWFHEHRFEEVQGGIDMIDQVHYVMPLGMLGLMAHRLFVRKRLEAIFSFRKAYLAQRFPSPPPPP